MPASPRSCCASACGWTRTICIIAFQSRVGREPWLKPYTDEVLAQLPAQGVRHVQVLCPGFAVDCLETLEEIAMRDRELFIAAGGERLDYIPALNDSPAHVDGCWRLDPRARAQAGSDRRRHAAVGAPAA